MNNEITQSAAMLRAAVDTLEQTLMEVSHAQENGAAWYTKGDSGLYQQVRLHLDRGRDAIKSIRTSAPADVAVVPVDESALREARIEGKIEGLMTAATEFNKHIQRLIDEESK